MLEHSDEDGSVYADSGDWNEDYNSFDDESDELSDGDVPLDALLDWLEDSDTDVRVRALDKLGELEPATIAQHANAVVARLDDSDFEVRCEALTTLAKL